MLQIKETTAVLLSKNITVRTFLDLKVLCSSNKNGCVLATIDESRKSWLVDTE